ncbi:ATPase [candidate division WWE3 bacterium CG_4_9_14_0_2_um_filter_35_11]|uniref:ATPase n=1 Tax=candidate division WWE3 bacterium CG_4_9_14_0_2_um_filter_35_11 TaxID=1975077 RepID=A0A2M8EMN0_UNCKA|nr:MAG: ATPase [candidate division WWE3 bacterium CG10_big_fil_rev_8_21_14_0_10_35_32]PJC23989.1 MAG: ATPase [candidate division WWE3 bacterium CG_4_9_14_0_2_um_filter_35_11]
MFTRDIWELLRKEIEKDEVLVLTGARQVGKTTTIKWILSQIQSENKYYFDLENISNRKLFLVSDYDSLIQEFQNLGLDISQKMYIAVDEIQLLPELPSIVKYLHDHYNIKFLITGSSSYYLKNLFSESMAGRKIIYELYPLSFSEFLRFRQEDYILPKFSYSAKFSKFAYQKLGQLYQEYTEFGGLPKVVLISDLQDKKKQLEMIFSSYINLDVQILSEFRSVKEFAKLVELLAGRIGNKINVSQLSKILGITRQTIDSYLAFMEQTYLIRLIQPFSKSADVRFRMSPKLYFVDTGIANINYDLSVGAKFENTLCHQLFLHANQNVFGRKLTYFADDNSEIGFILNDDYAFEIKETPVDTDLIKLSRNAEKIKTSKYRLIGKNMPSTFDDFIWGGMID